MSRKTVLLMLPIAIGTAILLLMNTGRAGAQGLSVNTSGAAADASAMLDVSSNSQGMLVPRMTAAFRTAISNPATGLLVYQTDGTSGFYYNSGTSGAPVWVSLSTGAPTGSAGGDLTGSYPNPTIAATAGAGNDAVAAINAGSGTINAANLNLTALNASNLTSGTVPTARLGSGTANTTTYLRGDNSWQTVFGGTTLNNGTVAGQIYVTNGTPFAVNPTPVAVSGNATLSSTGVLAITSLPAISGANLTNLNPANLTASGTFPVENGSNLTNLPAASLTGTISATALPTSGVTAGTYGSSTAIPSITVDNKGRVTAVTTNTVTASGGSGGGFFFNTIVMAALPGTTPVYGPLTQVPAANTTSPYPMNTTNGGFLTVAQACTLDAMYVMGVCRAAGTTSNMTETFTVYKNNSPTSLTGSFTISGLGTANQAFTPVAITGASVSVSPGDMLYIQWTNSNPVTGPLANAAWSIHAQ